MGVETLAMAADLPDEAGLTTSAHSTNISLTYIPGATYW